MALALSFEVGVRPKKKLAADRTRRACLNSGLEGLKGILIRGDIQSSATDED
jgi:hypothetical protein